MINQATPPPATPIKPKNTGCRSMGYRARCGAGPARVTTGNFVIGTGTQAAAMPPDSSDDDLQIFPLTGRDDQKKKSTVFHTQGPDAIGRAL